MTLRQFLYGVLVIAVIYAAAGTTGDPDLWGHVRFGQDMLAHRAIQLPDIYSFTADRFWINHEWLAEVLIATAFNHAGAAGLNVLRIALVASILAVFWIASFGIPKGRTLVVAAGAVGIYLRAHAIRPQVFSLLLFAILLALVARADHRRTLRPIIWIPILMAVWVNFHGGWIVGMGYFAAWCAATALTRSWRQRLALAGLLVTALASTLINPYGVGMWRFLAETVQFGRPMISDWQPLYMFSAGLWVSWFVGFCVLVLAASRARSRGDWGKILIAGGLGVAAIRVSRLDGFFALAAVFAAIGVLSQEKTAPRAVAREVRASRLLAAVFVLCIGAGSVALVPRIRNVPVPEQLLPDLTVASYVRERQMKGNVLIWFDWGEYAIWHFGPDLKVSIDGRRETVYGSNLVASHLEFYFGGADQARYADELKADYVWLPKHLPVVPALRNGWVTVCEGSSSILFARAPGPPCPSRPSGQRRWFPEL